MPSPSLLPQPEGLLLGADTTDDRIAHQARDSVARMDAQIFHAGDSRRQ